MTCEGTLESAVVGKWIPPPPENPVPSGSICLTYLPSATVVPIAIYLPAKFENLEP